MCFEPSFTEFQALSDSSCEERYWHKIDISTLAIVSHTTPQAPCPPELELWLNDRRSEDFPVSKLMESIE